MNIKRYKAILASILTIIFLTVYVFTGFSQHAKKTPVFLQKVSTRNVANHTRHPVSGISHPAVSYPADSTNGARSQLSCNDWLLIPDQSSYLSAGDLDIAGNQMTIEATINRTVLYTGSDLFAGDVVSKHQNPADVNYLLRPNSAEITTTNGYFKTPVICSIELNKTYHIAMVYDGVTLKFFRNGF